MKSAQLNNYENIECEIYEYGKKIFRLLQRNVQKMYLTSSNRLKYLHDILEVL